MSICLLLKTFHSYGLCSGLLPAPLRLDRARDRIHFGNRSHQRRCYLAYTACLNVLLIVLLPFTFPVFMYDESYMSDRLVLQWAFNLTNVTRIMAMLACGYLTWTKRKPLLQLGESLARHCHRCWLLESGALHSSGYIKLQRRIRSLLRQWFFVLNLSIVSAVLLLMRIDTDVQFSNLTMVVVHMMQFVYVAIMMTGLYVICLLLYWQMERVNLALKDLCSRLHHEERNALLLSASLARQTLHTVGHLFQLHCEGQRLMRSLFGIFDVTIAFLMLKMFVTNVNLMYHAVQFGNDSIATNSVTKLWGELVIVTHYWSAVLLMNMADDLTRRSGLERGEILRQFSDLELVKRDFQLELERFSDHLRCHSTAYKCCGLFVFNKQTSMIYFFSVLVNVLVLCQFYLKNSVLEIS
ncbi:putative gustatory receptor 58a [Drosophila obscura]|uniref:putative gustatory receptor 58a n=1 Tax=Drosophila obscura TaxID=7282 RepID=UPI001BB1B174|nr:putative gustatory receptor 58a [Drosophila obscura]XP_022230737.2 putative gustatory receptor 58a [Drosophila obscura]